VVLEFCEGPAGIMELPSRDGPGGDAADSAVREEFLEFVKREGESVVVGEENSDRGSSVRVFTEESGECLEGALDGRSSRASCSSNRAIGEGATSGCGWEVIMGIDDAETGEKDC